MESTVVVSREDQRTIVWLEGEHDVATQVELAGVLAKAIASDDADLVVDLRAVTFLSAGTLNELVRGREFLRDHSRVLTLRRAICRGPPHPWLVRADRSGRVTRSARADRLRMPGGRRLRILARLVGETGADFDTQRLCDVCAQETGASGAAVLLLSQDVAEGSICSTSERSALLAQLQLDLGEGPCVDAFWSHHPVLEPDLARPELTRWPAFAAPAAAGGARAVFAFPLQIGAVRLGALQLDNDEPGSLSDDQHADALVMADVAAEAVLVMQSRAPPGRLAAELEAGGNFQYAVHQASGMVAAQLEVTVGQALMRLRAHAFGNEQPLTDVAAAVIARTLRFDDRNTLETTDG